MFNIDEDELLTRVHKYELSRSGERLRIDVHEVIAGKYDHNFIAIPNLLDREARKASEDLFGFGTSEGEALEDCLIKIKDLSIQVVIPYDRRSRMLNA